MTSFIDQLARICDEHLLTEKVLIAPSLAVGHQIGDRLARNGTPWVNLRVHTINSLVDELVALDVISAGLTVLSRAQALGLVERACSDALGTGSYFSALSGQPGLAEAVRGTLDDLRHASVGLGSVNETIFEVAQKRADLQRVLERYEALLEEEKYIDRAGMLLRAIPKLRQATPGRDGKIWIDMRDGEATAAESELVELLTGGEVIRLAAPGDHESALRAAERPVEIFTGVGEENEVREIFRRLLKSRDTEGGETEYAGWDSAEIIYTQRESYLPLIFELAGQYDVPCTFAEGVPVVYTKPGQAVVGLLRWIADDFSAIALQRIAGSSVLDLGDGLTPLAFVRAMQRAAIGWGRDRYITRFDQLIASADDEAFWKEEAEKAKEFVARLLAIVPNTSDTLDVCVLAAAAKAFTEKFTHISNELDGMARSALVRMLDEVAKIASSPVSVAEACGRLTTAVESLHVGASNPRPGCLHVAGLTNGGYSGREQTFVVGLDDSKYPGKGLQDPILLDSERRGINSAIAPRQLPIVGDRPKQKIDAFWRVVATAGGAVTFSFSSFDLLLERDGFPASPLLGVFRILRRDPGATYTDLIGSLRESKARFVSSDPLDAAEWWAARAAASGAARDAAAAAVRRVYPWIADGQTAADARAGDELTEYDGRLSIDPALIDPRITGKVMSPSQIEMLAKCPFSWFLKYVVELRPIDELLRDPLQWIDAAKFGSLVHRILQRFMETLVERQEKPAFKHRELLEKIATQELEAEREKIPPPNDAAFESRVREVRETCSIFLTSEVEYCKEATPKYFEAAFGTEGENGCEISSPGPVEIPLRGGAKLRVRGRIDRVDQVGEGKYAVWDYKTGSPVEYKKSGRLHGGAVVQHAIYAFALEELLRRAGLKGSVVKSGYYFTSRKGEGERYEKHATLADLQEALNLLFDTVGGGIFPTDSDRCRFCDFPGICGANSKRTEEKVSMLTDPPPGLGAWRRLQDVQ